MGVVTSLHRSDDQSQASPFTGSPRPAVHIGRTPARFVRDARSGASRLPVATREPLTVVIRRRGFASAESLRQAFVAGFGLTSPSSARRPCSSAGSGH